MEKMTITIEIKQEVSILLLWLAGGIVAVTIAFFIPAQTTELWPQFYTAGGAALVYLIALLLYSVRKPVSMTARILTLACSVITLGAIVFSSIRMDSTSHVQMNTLANMKTTHVREIMFYKLPRPLLATLRAYYQQEPGKKETLSQVFQRQNGSVPVGSNINKPLSEGDTLKIIVETVEPDRLVLVTQETSVKGRDPEFLNYNGQKGMIQEKCTLTTKGVKYESEN
jgi:hypothetical protein